MPVSVHQSSVGSLGARLKANRGMLVLAVAGFLPLLWNFFVLSWQRPAYQFFPMAFAAAGLLAWRAAEEVPPGLLPGRLGMARGLVLVTAGVWLAANYLWSPWLGYMGFLLGLACAVWGLGGRPLMAALLPMGLVLVAIVPPPLGLDEILTIWLRGQATDLSSRLLDWLQVTHLRDGNTILLPGRTMLMEEACSGINSFVLCNVFCLFWFMWQRRPLYWLLFALPATSAFVVLGNTLRITTCAVADFFWHVDLLNGWRHDVFGLVLLVSYCLLVMSLDQLLVFFKGHPSEPAAAPPAPASPVESRSTRYLLGFPLVGAFFALVGLGFFAGHLFRQGESHALTPVRMFNSTVKLNLTMPQTLAGWKRINSNVGDLVLVQTLGINSQSWRYEYAGETTTVAVDYPLDGFHNVKYCYVDSGWQVESETPLLAGSDRQDTHALRLALEKSHQHAVVYHSVMAANGSWLAAPKSFETRFAAAPPPAGYRIQLISAGDGGGYLPMSPATESHIAAFYMAARQTLAAQVVEQLAGPHAK